MRTLAFVSVIAILALATSCSSNSAKAPVPSIPSHQPPKDLAGKFSSEGQIRMQLVPDHLLGKDFMPGGNLADYKTEAGEFQMFLLEFPDPKRAAFMLLDWKNVLTKAEYLAHMGGYFGEDKGHPIYVFSKSAYLVGIVGLPQAKADAEARRFAERL